MITPAIKDQILNVLISQDKPNVNLNYDDLFPNNEIPVNEFFLIIKQFAKYGFLENPLFAGNMMISAQKTADIYDFFNHGGFTAQEELLRANLEKLNLELLKLSKDIEPSKLETISSITAIASSVATALGLFK